MTENVSIQQANADTDYGVAMKIRENALDLVNKAKIEIIKTEDAAKQADSGGGAASVYGGIISEIVAPGAKLGMTVVEGVLARAEEAPRNAGGETTEVRSIDGDIGLAARAPGVYAALPQSVYGGNPKGSTDLSGNVLEQVAVTKASLRVPKDTEGLVQTDKAGNVGGMKCEVNNKTLSSAKYAQELVFEKEYASKAALDSTFTYQKTHGAAVGMAIGSGVAPQMAMKLAPKDIHGLVNEVRTDTV